MDKGLGSVTWWGFSPALDLLEIYELKHGKHEAKDLSVLIIGQGDIRHLLKTICQRYRHLKKDNSVTVHFYILENNLEVYARILLLTAVSLESPSSMGLQEKTELFTEIYGNTLVRSQSAQYTQFMSNEFVKMVTDFDILKNKLPFFDLEMLKYKERDMIESIFKLWRKPATDLFDISKCWDLRVRQHLGTRYDSSKGVFDWDYSMKLCDRGGEIISSRAYQQWRKNGVAFQLRDGTYDVPNKTLASGMVFKVEGESHARRGYWGDIVVSPYISFGIECDDETYFKRANREYISNSEQVTQYNLTSMFHELQTGEKYIPPKAEKKADKTDLDTLAEEEECDESCEASCNKHDTAEKKLEFISLKNIKISFLPLGSLQGLASKSRFLHLFDMVYLSNSMVHHLIPPISDIFANQAVIILETAKFITELNKEQYIQFAQRISELAQAVGCRSMVDCDAEKDCFSYFEYSRTS